MKETANFCYSIICQDIQASIEFPVVPKCNGWTAINAGDTAVTVEGILLLPALAPGATGASIQVGGNLGEVYKGRLQVTFQPPFGANPRLQLIQKFYT